MTDGAQLLPRRITKRELEIARLKDRYAVDGRFNVLGDVSRFNTIDHPSYEKAKK